jgi:hypothetical protein
MARYTFDTLLLSAQKTGNPPLTNTSLSSDGVRIVYLNTLDKGIAFNRKTTLSNTLCSFNAFGSAFQIDKNYHYSPMAISNNSTYTFFTYSSASNSLTDSLGMSGQDINIWDSNKSRMHILGYI